MWRSIGVRVLTAFTLGCAVCLACAPAPDRGPPVSFVDSAGVRIVSNAEPAWTGDALWSVTAAPLLEIGATRGPDEQDLHMVLGATRLSDGTTALIDGGSRTVRMYDTAGLFLRTLGGPGQDPGEFQYPSAIFSSPGDTIMIWDNPSHRLTRFSYDGAYLDLATVDRGRLQQGLALPLVSAGAEVLPDGRVLVRLFEAGTRDPKPEGFFRPRGGVIVMGADGTGLDTLMLYQGIEQMFVGDVAVVRMYSSPTWISYAGLPTTVCVGKDETHEISCFDETGQETRVRWRAPTVPVTEAEIEVWRARTVRAYARTMEGSAARRLLDRVTPPEFRPPYARHHLDVLGNLWVMQMPSLADLRAEARYWVFDEGGRWMGELVLPSIQILEIGSDYLLGVHRDENDVESVQMYGLNRSG